MGRNSGTQSNQASDTYSQQVQADSLRRTNAATDAFNSQLKTLAGGGTIAANPYKNSEYLQNQNLLTSAATSAQNTGAKELLNTDAQRGGLNTSSRRATFADLARQRMRASGDAVTAQNAQNYDKNLDWQKFILGSTLAPANVDTTLFNTATGERNTATKNLADIQNAQNAMWGQIIGAGIGAAGSLGSAGITRAKG